MQYPPTNLGEFVKVPSAACGSEHLPEVYMPMGKMSARSFISAMFKSALRILDFLCRFGYLDRGGGINFCRRIRPVHFGDDMLGSRPCPDTIFMRLLTCSVVACVKLLNPV